MTFLILLEITLVPSSHTTYFLSCQDLNTGDNKQFQFSCCCLVLVQVRVGGDGISLRHFQTLFSPFILFLSPRPPPLLSLSQQLPSVLRSQVFYHLFSPSSTPLYNFFPPWSPFQFHIAHVQAHTHTLKSQICRAANMLVFESSLFCLTWFPFPGKPMTSFLSVH